MFAVKVYDLMNFMTRKTKIWPIKIEDDGRFRLDILNIKSLISVTIYIGLVCCFFWISFPTLQEVKKNPVNICHIFFANIYMISTIPCWTMAAFSISKLNKQICSANAKISFKSFAYVVMACFMSQMYVCIQQGLFFWNNLILDSPWKTAAFFISIITLDVMNFILQIGYILHFEVASSAMRENLSETLGLGQITVTDMKALISGIQKVNSAMAMNVCQVFFVLQIAIIASVYLVFGNIRNIHAICFSIGNLIFVFCFINGMEECYDLANEVVVKAKETSAEMKSVAEMTKLQAAADELKECFPLTAMKFFSIERSTITAMAANTLTYLIVGIQMFDSGSEPKD